jgi:hypothetical protein
MKSTKRTRTTKPPSRRAVKDLPTRKGSDAKAGESWLVAVATTIGDLGSPTLQHEATHVASKARS